MKSKKSEGRLSNHLSPKFTPSHSGSGSGPGAENLPTNLNSNPNPNDILHSLEARGSTIYGNLMHGVALSDAVRCSSLSHGTLHEISQGSSDSRFETDLVRVYPQTVTQNCSGYVNKSSE